jgi:maltose alpha-D-glucosyltransferase/alpha-amylase
MQLFGRGLRRRLPTMLNGDEARLRMIYSLAFALPGAPVLFYGEEIGMAENLAIPGRLSVRSPMQWSPERHGGFSSAPRERWSRPMVTGRRWGPAAVNAGDQDRDPASLLNWMQRLIDRRRQTPEIAFGACSVLPLAVASVLALRYDWDGHTVLILHNLAAEPTRAECVLPDAAGWAGFGEILGEGEWTLGRDGALSVDLAGYGYRWLRVRRREVRPRG